VVGVGLEHGPRTLTLRADHATHLLRRRRRGGKGDAEMSVVRLGLDEGEERALYSA
jgi:hypothetical protein